VEWSQINLPPLAGRYTLALRAAIEFIFAEFKPFGVIVSGSIVRGNPDASSDFDILVLHNYSWRRRVQRWFEGVPAEIFVNSPDWMDTYFREESAAGRPVMADMLTTGSVVYSSSPDTRVLIEKAHKSLRDGAHFSEDALQRQRYTAACLFEDALEIAARDDATAMLILGRALDAAVRYWFASRQRFAVRPKEEAAVIMAEDAVNGALLREALTATTASDRFAAARKLGEQVVGHVGFFEWDSGPSEASDG